MRLTQACCIVVLTMLAGTTRMSADYEVSAKDLRLRVDDRARIVSLMDGNGFEYLATPGLPLFEAILQDVRGGWAKSDAAAHIPMQVGRTVEGNEVTVKAVYRDFMAPGVTVSASIRADATRVGVRFQLETDMPEGAFFTEITQPVVKLGPRLGDELDDDRLFVPNVDGVVLKGAAIQTAARLISRYPGQASMQWMSWYDAQHGLGFMLKDAAGHPKWIGYECAEDGSIGLRWAMLFAQQHVAHFVTPEFEIVFAPRTWEAMAEHYRPWAMQQPWVTERQTNGMDRELVQLHEIDLALEFDCRPQGCGILRLKADDVARYIRSHTEDLRSRRAVLVMRGFEKHGVYIMPDALPFLPALRTACDQAHLAGARTYAMTAMLKWAIERKEFKTPHYNVDAYDGEAYFAENDGLAVTAVSWDGKHVIERNGVSWDPDHARLCVGTPYAETYVKTFSEELAKAGIDILEWDQMNGGGATWCFSKEHGHPVGQGKWQTDATQRLFKLSRHSGREIRPDFCLSIEDPCEYWLSVVDIPTKRPVFRSTWPGAGPGSITVPAFSYVYGRICPMIDLDAPCPANWSVADLPPERLAAMVGWQRFTSKTGIRKVAQQTMIEENAYAEARVAAASSTLYGCIPTVDVPPWQHQMGYSGLDSYVMPTCETIDPDHRRLLQNLLKTVTGPGRDFVRKGTMAAIVQATTPTWDVTEARQGTKVRKLLPRLLGCAYRLGPRLGLLLANTDEEAHTVDVAALEGLPSDVGSIRRIWINGEACPVSADTMTYDVPVLSVLVLEF